MLKRKWMPCAFTDTPALEAWLAEQAERGLFLENAGVLTGSLLFRRGEPRRLTYCILPQDRKDCRSGDQLEAAYADQGWHHVCRLRGPFIVFSAETPAAPPPELAPEVRKQAERKVGSGLLTQLLCLALLVVFWLWRFPPGDMAAVWRDSSLLDRLTAVLPLALLYGLALALLASEARRYLHALLAWRQVTAGQPASSGPLMVRLYNSLRLAALALSLLALLTLLASGTGRTFLPVSRTRADLPLVTLDLLETEPIYYAPAEDGPSVDVSRRFGLLVAEDIQIKSLGMRDPDTNWRETDYLSHPDASLTFSYYRLRTAGLARRVAEDELLRTCGQADARPGQGFDAAYTALLETGEQYLCAQAGDVVVTARYRGSGSLEAHIADIQAVTAAYRDR